MLEPATLRRASTCHAAETFSSDRVRQGGGNGGAALPAWLEHIKEGDLILARGRMRQNSYERDGQKVYTVDLICEDFSVLAHKFERSEGEGD
jgi:hypothetical protein